MERTSFRPFPTTCLIVFALLNAVPALAQDAQAGPHVRSDDPKLRKVIEDGLNQSPTFRSIVVQIDQLPGFVFVASSRCGANSALDACLDHKVTVGGGYRFLRVNILPGESGAKLLALVAHELQHALEVLSDESATSQEGVAKLYERIGMRRKGVGNFETEAALRVQATVFGEVRSHTRGRQRNAQSLPPQAKSL